jgi:ribose transport system permease protein
MANVRIRMPAETSIFLVLVVVAAAMALMSPTFGTVSNGLGLLLNGSVIGFLALGQMFVLLTGGIDLSTAANMALTGVLGTLFMRWGLPWQAAVALALCVAVLTGVTNGILVHYVRIPAFIATFGIQGVAASLAQVITNGVSITAEDSGFAWLGQGKIAGIPVPVLLLLAAAIVVGAGLKWTKLGVHVYALGGNPRAARLAGVNTARTTIFVYAASALFAGLGGLITASRLMVGFPYVGSGNELFYSIAAAVVGGVSLFGGIGTTGGVMIGAVLIATVANGMNVMNVSSYWQPFVIGVIILVGVSFDTYRRTMSGRGLQGLRIGGVPIGRSGAAAPGATPAAGPTGASPPSQPESPPDRGGPS